MESLHSDNVSAENMRLNRLSTPPSQHVHRASSSFQEVVTLTTTTTTTNNNNNNNNNNNININNNDNNNNNSNNNDDDDDENVSPLDLHGQGLRV